jgi:hypothetical protein
MFKPSQETPYHDFIINNLWEKELIRYLNGKLRFEFGPDNWTKWYKDPYRNVSIPFAANLANAAPSIEVFQIYYYQPEDFHHIRFDFQGDTYILEWYKIITLHRKSDGHRRMFGFKWESIHYVESQFRNTGKINEGYWESRSRNLFDEVAEYEQNTDQVCANSHGD